MADLTSTVARSKCKGSGRLPIKIVPKPAGLKEKTGNMPSPVRRGRTGRPKPARGICSVCRKEFSLSKSGVMSLHKDPDTLDKAYLVEIEEETYAKIISLADYLKISPEIWLNVIIDAALNKNIDELVAHKKKSRGRPAQWVMEHEENNE